MTKPKSKPKAAPRSTSRSTNKSKSRRRLTPSSPKSAARPETKHARIIAMLRTTSGTTIAAIMTATDWQQHSVRAFSLVWSARSSVSIWFPNRPTKVGFIESRMERLRPPLSIA